MFPSFFGENSYRLFGVYHAPAVSIHHAKQIIICSPIAHEYMKSYHLLKLLSEKLSQSGHHVLRFDWFGHGDSSGNFESCTFNTWCCNINQAIDYLSSCSLKVPLFIIGFRLGASILLKQASKLSMDHSIILCDPVLSGNQWLKSIQTIHETIFSKDMFSSSRDNGEYIGFLYSKDLLSDIQNFNALSLELNGKQYDLVCSECEKMKNGSFFSQSNSFIKSLTSSIEPDVWGTEAWYDRIIMNSTLIGHVTTLVNRDAND